MVGLQKTSTYLVIQKIWPHYSRSSTLLQAFFTLRAPKIRYLSQPRTNHHASVVDSSDTAYKITKAMMPDSQRRKQVPFLFLGALSHCSQERIYLLYASSEDKSALVFLPQVCFCSVIPNSVRYSLFRNKRFGGVWGQC